MFLPRRGYSISKVSAGSSPDVLSCAPRERCNGQYWVGRGVRVVRLLLAAGSLASWACAGGRTDLVAVDGSGGEAGSCCDAKGGSGQPWGAGGGGRPWGAGGSGGRRDAGAQTLDHSVPDRIGDARVDRNLDASSSSNGGSGADRFAGFDADAADDVPDDGSQVSALLGAPWVFAPTSHGFGLNAVLATGSPSSLRARVRRDGDVDWTDLGVPEMRASDIAQWRADGLQAGTQYQYAIAAQADGAETSLFTGRVTTQRGPGQPFRFALLTDSHISPREVGPGDRSTQSYAEETLSQVGRDIAASHPDFLIHLGDVLDFHLFGFNVPPPEGSWTRLGYMNYRRLLGDTLGNAPHFVTIGNWDGEDGFFTPEEADRSRLQRLLYAPGPTPNVYPEGGSTYEDYYAFTWGDALFVVLNVMSYTPTRHLLGTYPGVPDDWTLGEAQLTWLRQTLERATSRWRFLFIHHAVGGAAGDDIESAYGRGGGQAARVGEQAIVHELMLKHGVQIFFYGHDHVFTDMLVDGIHYTLPGSAGAPWKFEGDQTGYTQYWTQSGHATVDVNPTSVHVSFIAQGGERIHEYTRESP